MSFADTASGGIVHVNIGSKEGTSVMTEENAEPTPPTPEFMMSNDRHGVRGANVLTAQIRSLVPGAVVTLRLVDPANPESSRTAAHGIARRAGFRVRTHKDAAGIYWVMRTADDSTNE